MIELSLPIVSRTRCGILHAAPQSRDPASALVEAGAPALQRTASQGPKRVEDARKRAYGAALRPGRERVAQ
jgi:hypothetical protein